MNETPRAHPRYAVELDAELTIGSERAKGRTQNISKGGFCLESETAVSIGEHGVARLALVFEEGQFSEQLEIACQIMWCTKRSSGGYQVGVRFADIGAEMEQYLSIFIRYLEDGDGDGDGDDGK